jgi:hypothetical protein
VKYAIFLPCVPSLKYTKQKHLTREPYKSNVWRSQVTYLLTGYGLSCSIFSNVAWSLVAVCPSAYFIINLMNLSAAVRWTYSYFSSKCWLILNVFTCSKMSWFLSMFSAWISLWSERFRIRQLWIWMHFRRCLYGFTTVYGFLGDVIYYKYLLFKIWEGNCAKEDIYIYIYTYISPSYIFRKFLFMAGSNLTVVFLCDRECDTFCFCPPSIAVFYSKT